MLDWIFEGIVTWVSSIASELMDAVSRVFLAALGTDMDAMEGYFPFVVKAFDILQYMAWTILFLITVWQLFRVADLSQKPRTPGSFCCEVPYLLYWWERPGPSSPWCWTSPAPLTPP